MIKATYAQPILLPVRPRWGTEKSLFCKGFAELQTTAFEGDDELIVAVKNRSLTGNKTAGAVKQKKITTFYHFKA